MDYFNHDASPNLDIQFDDYACTVYASRDIQAGEPLTISLGDASNPSSLFATYGFLDESAPGTFCKLMDLQRYERYEVRIQGSFVLQEW